MNILESRKSLTRLIMMPLIAGTGFFIMLSGLFFGWSVAKGQGIGLLPPPERPRNITLQWDANPAGEEVRWYQVKEDVGSRLTVVGATAATRLRLRDLRPGKHKYVVTAVNQHGESSPSIPIEATVN